MVIVGTPYGIPKMFDISEPRGGGRYDTVTLAGGDGSRLPSEREFTIARYQGRHVAEVARKLAT